MGQKGFTFARALIYKSSTALMNMGCRGDSLGWPSCQRLRQLWRERGTLCKSGQDAEARL